MNNERTDDELVVEAQRAARGDSQAFQLLVQRHQSRILANCRHLGATSGAEAEDLAQDVFVKAFFGLKHFQGRSAFKTWLFRIKINHCLNHATRRRRAAEVELDENAAEAPAAPPAAHRHLEDMERRERIVWVLDQLPESLKIPLVLRDLDGLSYQEIAERLGIGLSAVKMRIKRGRTQFRSLYGSLAEEAKEER